MQIPGLEDSQRKFEKQYTLNEAKEKINDWLYQQLDQEFDFKFVNWAFKDDKRYQLFRRRIYLRNKCPNKHKINNKNIQNNKDSKDNPWADYKIFTTSYGTVQIKYHFQNINKFLKEKPAYKRKDDDHSQMKYPYILKWSMNLYRMACKQCPRIYKLGQEPVYAQVFILQPELDYLIIDFFDIIQRFLTGKKKKKKQHCSHRRVLKGHKEELCQACSLGICRRGGRKNNKQL